MITTGGEGHFYWKNANVGFWFDGVFNSDYNFNGQGVLYFRSILLSLIFFLAGEDFDTELTLPNVDFGTYVCFLSLYMTCLASDTKCSY